MQRLRKPHSKGEGPPVFSHEFVIQNHADIISCVCMVIFMGLIPQATNHLASTFIFVQYNVTGEPANIDESLVTSRVDIKPLPETHYQHGLRDGVNVLFYSMVWIILHALAQEYIWERTVKRIHLSKTKTAKYYDSGCLVVFYLASLVWGIDHIIKEGYVQNWTLLWEDYPHINMRLSLKFFMLNQMAFWLHCYPELYFMKTKKEELYSKLVLYTSSILMIAGAYMLKLQRLALVLLMLHYFVELLFHVSRLLHYHGKDDIAATGFKLWKVLLVVVRIVTVVIAVVTLWFGLGRAHEALKARAELREEMEVEDLAEGEEPEVESELTGLLKDFDPTQWWVRLLALAFVVLLQLWVGWTFINYQLERSSPKELTTQSEEGVGAPKRGSKKANGNKKSDKTNKPKTS